MSEPILEMKNISKNFGSVIATEKCRSGGISRGNKRFDR